MEIKEAAVTTTNSSRSLKKLWHSLEAVIRGIQHVPFSPHYHQHNPSHVDVVAPTADKLPSPGPS